MPTWAEADEIQKEAIEKRKKANHKGIRTKGAVFIRNPGQQLAPVHAAAKENRKLRRTQKQREREAEAANVVAKSKKAMMILDLKKEGIPEHEAIAMTEQAFKEQAQVPKTQEQKEIEIRVNEEAKNIFAAWDDDGDGQLSPAELRQALTLAGFNTGTDFVEEIMEEFDIDGDGMMDIDEFRVMLHVLYTGQRSKGVFGMIASMFPGVSDHAIYQNEVLTDNEIDMYKQVFNDADESGDMLLDEGELQFLLVKSGFIFGQRTFVYEAMRNMDTSGDGAVDFGEFLVFMAKIKTKKLEADSWMNIGGPSVPPPPPLPTHMAPLYYKVARFFPSLAPTFEKRFCELADDGQLVIAETRGAVMRLLSRTNANRSGRGYDQTGEVVIDLSFVDEIASSAWGNAAGTKIEVSTLTEVWYFKAETKELADEFRAGLITWRDHLSFVHYCKANNLHDPRYDQTDNDSKKSKSLVKQARKTILNPMNLLAMENEDKKKKKKNRKGNADGAGAAAAGTAGAGVASRSMNREERVSASKVSSSRPAGVSRSASRMNRSKKSISIEGSDYSDGTLDYDFDDDEDDDDPDSGTDEEESVRGSFR